MADMTSSALYKAPNVAGFPEVAFEEKQRLFDLVKADMRFPDYLYGCYECGICVAACPSGALGYSLTGSIECADVILLPVRAR